MTFATRALVSSDTVPATALAYTSALPLVFTFVITSGRTVCTLRTQPTLVAEQVTAHFVDPRVAACTHCTAEERPCLFQAVTGGEEIYLRPSDPSLFNFNVAPRHPLQFLQYSTCVMLKETRLKEVLGMFAAETEQVSMSGNFAPEAINTSKQCQRSAMDCVVMH